MNGDTLLGIVEDRAFQRLSPGEGTARLTRMGMQEAMPPETEEILLDDYEGRALLVGGHDGGDWIYQAEIVEAAGPILTMVVTQVFGERGGPGRASEVKD